METLYTVLHGTFLLFFGVILSAAFADLRFSRKNMLMMLLFCAFSGLLQGAALFFWDDSAIWPVYPLITHAPLVLLLHLFYRKKWATALISVLTAYLCCQPSKWFGVLTSALFPSLFIEYLVRWCILLLTALITLRYFVPYFSQIYSKDSKSVFIFGIIPITYYAFDYTMGIYTDLWLTNNRVAREFLPFFLCIAFFVFCIIYYKEYEQKADALRKEQMICLAVEQQAKEMETIRGKEHEIRLLLHDMRMLLSCLALSVEEGDRETALKMIRNYTDSIDSTAIRRYSTNPMLNSVLSNYASRYEKEQIPFVCSVQTETLPVDEAMFCSVLSNALDNALNAQLELPVNQRNVLLNLRSHNGKLLISLSNPILTVPAFVDGMPVSDKPGHGYGTQSIRFMVERMKGTCQFIVKDKTFIFRAIL